MISRRKKFNEIIRQQAANLNLTFECINTMATGKESVNSLKLPNRQCFYSNQVLKNDNKEVNLMVLNSGVDVKSRNEFGPINTNKMEARKILTQEITLTSKAPLKILELLETTTNSGTIDNCLISECCKYLKKKGKELDHEPYTVALNHYFDTMRNLSRDTSVDLASRKKLLEIIELRSRQWMTTEELDAYYAKKKEPSFIDRSSSRDNYQTSINLSTSTSSPTLHAAANIITNINNNSNNIKQPSPDLPEASVSPSSSGDVIKHSGKFQRPVKVPGKNFLKDEFIIKNCDSGKVNPGAKDRLLQITGPDESSINKAKYYIGDTIKRNASPIPCDKPLQSQQPQQQQQPAPLNQSWQLTSFSTPAVNKLLNEGQSSNAFFTQTLSVGNHVLVISSSQTNLAKEAKSVLEEYFQRPNADAPYFGPASESDDSEVSANTSQTVTFNGDSLGPEPSVNKQPSVNNFKIEKKYQKSASHESLSSTNTLYFQLSKDKLKDGHGSSRKIVYDREFLLKCANSELSKVQSHAIKLVTKQIPDIARKQRQIRANSVESAMA